MKLINGDCLEVMRDLSDNSIDFLFADLPYGQTSCKWDCIIDLSLFWKQANRICKQDAAMAFTCSVKFGNTLINSNPKCFRYDLIWVKSSACGFLNAKKMPMKKHEMVYLFYRKLPKVYTENIALHHTHKFLKPQSNGYTGKCYGGEKKSIKTQYTPPLPNSVIKEENIVVEKDNDYENREIKTRNTIKNEENYGKEYLKKKQNFRSYNKKLGAKGEESHLYDPPLPNSVIKEETFIRGRNKTISNKDVYDSDERFNNGKLYHHNRKLQKGDDPIYDPPLPNSVIKEENVVETRDTTNYKNNSDLYGNIDRPDFKRKNGESRYTPPLPNSIIKEENIVVETNYNTLYGNVNIDNIHKTRYDPPLPNTILEIKSEKGKHATQKPVPLMEWLIKYYTREGELVLDPTMGSGSTGIACKNLNREFIGIEKDEEIYKVAIDRNK